MNRRKLIAAASLLGLSSACALGCSKSDPPVAATTSGTTATPEIAAKASVVNIVANDKGFTPSSVDVRKGAATQLVFMRTTDETCAKQVVFPELKITKDLPLNVKVAIDVPVADARTLTFQCGMGMFKGKVVIQ
jgi:plastocyanin domain-containing protein